MFKIHANPTTRTIIMTPNFTNSFQPRYDEYWNNVVVPSFKALKKALEISVAPENVYPLIQKYCNSVSTVVNNLARQKEMLEDKKEIASYLKITKEEAREDLETFLKEVMDNPLFVKLINNTLSEIKLAGSVQRTFADAPIMIAAPALKLPAPVELNRDLCKWDGFLQFMASGVQRQPTFEILNDEDFEAEIQRFS